MELFIWLWAFDKRLLCGLKYGIHSFKHVWLVPALSSLIVLGITYIAQIKSEHAENSANEGLATSDMSPCLITDVDLLQTKSALQRLMII